jgi:hypothetical protein
MTERVKTQLQLLRAQLMADKKKASIMGVLAIVLVVVVGRLLFSSGPSDTTASQPPPAVTPVIAATAATPSATAQCAAAAAAPVSPVRETNAEQTFTAHRTVSVSAMPRDLARDLFTTKEWSKFTPAVLVGAVGEPGKAGRRRHIGLWGQLRQSWSEYNREQHEVSEEFRRDLEQLQLHSTLTGPEPLAHISGRLVRPGDEIHGFSVVRIAEREVVVSRGGLTAGLTMK